jgi:hypothetical protein
MSRNVFLTAFLFTLLAAFSAFPVLIGFDVTSPYGTPGHQFTGDTAIAELGDVWWSPTAPPIWKIFTTDGTGGTIHLSETFRVSGDVPFTDWDEQLMVQDGTGGWVPSPETDGLIWLGGQSNPPGTVTIDEPNDIIVIKWQPPLPPGTNVLIQKDIFVPEGIRTFAVAQWPTVPEPSMYAFGGIALLGMLVVKRKSY